MLARQLGVDAYQGARLAGALRGQLVEARESLVLETVYPFGDKLDFLVNSGKAGYHVVLCFIGIASSSTFVQRVAHFENGVARFLAQPAPDWLIPVIPRGLRSPP